MVGLNAAISLTPGVITMTTHDQVYGDSETGDPISI